MCFDQQQIKKKLQEVWHLHKIFSCCCPFFDQVMENYSLMPLLLFLISLLQMFKFSTWLRFYNNIKTLMIETQLLHTTSRRWWRGNMCAATMSIYLSSPTFWNVRLCLLIPLSFSPSPVLHHVSGAIVFVPKPFSCPHVFLENGGGGGGFLKSTTQ